MVFVHALLFTEAIIGSALIVAWVGIFSLVFWHLWRHHPGYYKNIGSPSVIGTPQYSSSWLLGWQYMFSSTAHGLPSAFGLREARCRTLQRFVRRSKKPVTLGFSAWGICVAFTMLLTLI